MPSTYSSNLKIELQANGENAATWGDKTNTNLGTALEQAIVGYATANFTSDANLTLPYTDTSTSQVARALVLNVTSAVSLTVTRELIVPTIQKQYIVQNNTTGSQSITVKTSAGSGVTIPSGRKMHVYVDGTNVIQMFDFLNTLTLSGNATFNSAVTVAGLTSTNTFNATSSTVSSFVSRLTNQDFQLYAVNGVGTNNTGDVKASLGLYYANVLAPSNANGVIEFVRGSNANTGWLNFLTSGVERMRLDSSGNLGIGTASPSQRLHVNGSTIVPVANSYFTFDVRFGIGTPDSSGLQIFTGDLIRFGTRTLGGVFTERMTLDSSGNLGIGTASPAQRLDVSGSARIFNPSADSQVILVAPSDSFSPFVRWGVSGIRDSGLLGFAPGDDALVYRSGANSFSNGNERFRITASGNVGIGTASPATRLDVQGPFGVESSIRLTAPIDGTAATPAGSFFSFRSGTALRETGRISSLNELANFNGGNLVFSTSDSSNVLQQRAVIDRSGNIGIGTASPAAYGGYTTLAINNATNGGLIDLLTNGTRVLTMYAGSTAVFGTVNTSNLAFHTVATERMRLDTNGNLGIGTISPTVRLEVATAGGAVAAGRFYSPSTTNGARLELADNNTNFNLRTIPAGGTTDLSFTRDGTSFEMLRLNYTGSVAAGRPSLATNATDGFLYVPTCAGTPTGTPTAVTGFAPIVVNTTNNKLYFYSGGAWRDAGP